MIRGNTKVNQKETKEKNRRGRKYVTIMLAFISLAVWLVIILIKYLVLKSRGIDFDFNGLLDGILDNILGILPPIIIFNFAYEYFTQDYVSEEMSEQITQTLMSDPRAIARFEKKAKMKFVHTTLLSMLREEQGQMVYDMIQPYIASEMNIRKYFKYKLIISDFSEGSIFPNQLYFRLQEKLAYRKLYLSSEQLPSQFNIGFFMEDVELDQALKQQQFLFREDLKINQAELDMLIAMTPDQKKCFITEFMKLKVFIDNKEAILQNTVIDQKGILLTMVYTEQIKKEIMVEVGFQMPMLRTNGKIFASISEPTYSPNIELSYPDDKIKVVMIPFLNGSTSSQDAMHYDGMCEVVVQDEWILPMSGVAFLINCK